MTNLVSPWTMETIKNRKISMPMPGDRKLQQIDVPDIASVVTAVIKGRESYFKRRINIASDELSGNKMAETLSETVGKNFVYEEFDPSYMREQSADMADMYEWFNKVGYSVDIKGLKNEFPDISFSSFEDYVQRIDWSFMN
jgi:nucleoside-diphosphate-sugar epimerase